MHTHTCVHTRCICTHAYCLSYVQLYSCPPEHIYTIHFTCTLRLVLKVSANISLYDFFPFPVIARTYLELVTDFICSLLPGLEHQSKGAWCRFNHANVLHCAKYVHHMFIPLCCNVYRISQVGKKKRSLCSSSTVLGTGMGASVRFLSSGSLVGLRVHNSVRYNYEKLIPGKPVWHIIHDASHSDLIPSSLTVEPHSSSDTRFAQSLCSHQSLRECSHTDLLAVPSVK